MKKKIRDVFFALFFVILLIGFQSANAQTDSAFSQLKDSTSLTENTNGDTTQTEDGYDTSGYFFNWKEYADDPFTTGKIKTRISADTTIKRLQNDDEFWYVKSIEDFKKNAVRLKYDKKYRDSLSKQGFLPPDEQVFTQEESGDEWYLQRWFRNTIWVILISIFIAAVIYFLVVNKISLIRKKPAKQNDESSIADDNFLSSNYDQLLQKYTTEKNYRFAVRVLYLQLLQLLNERGIISYQPQFTNTQYLQQLQPSSLYQKFVTVTHHYEYIWYGEFRISEEAFKQIQTDFITLKNGALQL